MRASNSTRLVTGWSGSKGYLMSSVGHVGLGHYGSHVPVHKWSLPSLGLPGSSVQAGHCSQAPQSSVSSSMHVSSLYSFAWRNTEKCSRSYRSDFIFNLSHCSPSLLSEEKGLIMNTSLWTWPNTVFCSIPLQKSSVSLWNALLKWRYHIFRHNFLDWNFCFSELPIQWVFSGIEARKLYAFVEAFVEM